MFCHTCFASHNNWLAGPAVGLRTERTYLHYKREGCTYCCSVLLHAEKCGKLGIFVHGDGYEFRDGAPIADGVLLLDELAMMGV